MVGGAFVVAAAAMLAGAGAARLHRRNTGGSLSSCGVKGASGPSSLIVNGEQATECEWRWQAVLRTSNTVPPLPYCGGTLIAPEWVLTTANCVYTKGKENFDVVLGDYRTDLTSANEQTRLPAEVFVHPDYDQNSYHNANYALVRLESPVSINDCVGTVCLPTAGADIAQNSTCWVTGWGRYVASSRGPTSNVLQEAAVRIIGNDECVETSSYAPSEIDDSMICAQGRTASGATIDTCMGDWGGPLVCEADGQWTVYGASSWSEGCANELYPSIYARVHKVLDWIDDVMAGTIATPLASTP